MKKSVKIILIALLALFILIVAAAIVVPIVFKPQLLEIARTEINKNVNAKVEFTDFKVSIIKGFPNLYIGLMNLSVVGVDEFEGETLVSFDEFSVKVNLRSVIKMENIKIKSVRLINPVLNAIINADGKVNWDIALPTDDAEEEMVEEETTKSEPMTLRVALEKFEIRNATIKYIDREGNMEAYISNLNYLLNGNMGLNYSDLNMKTTVEKFDFYMDGIRFVKEAKMTFDAEIGADMENFIFTFKNNTFSINDIQVAFEGNVKMPSDDIDVDITFGSTRTDFKSILSMVPAIYMTDFEGLKASGNVNLTGWVKGSVTETTLPSIGLDLIVDNARFHYPDLPKSVENVNINTKIYYDGVDDDKTTVNVSRFHLELGGNPFDMTLSIATPMSDMQMAGTFKGVIDFGSLADVIPLKNTKISGILESNVEFGGLMSYIDNEQFDKFKADGSIKLSNFFFESPDLPQGMKIIETKMDFTPRYVNLSKFDAVIGKSDMQMNGRLENFIPFVFADETLKGNLNISSSLIDANEFLADSEEIEPEVQDTLPMSVIEIPKNIDFVLASNIKKVKYDKLDIDDIKGKIIVRDGKVNMENLSMNLLKGSMLLTGEYNTQDINKPSIDFLMDIRNFDIPSAFNAFSMLEKVAPQVKDVTGNVSTKFTLTSLLDSTMGPILNTVNARGVLGCQNIAIVNSKVFGKVGDLLKNDNLKNPKLKDFQMSLTIKDGVTTIEPFDTELAGIKMNMGGTMTLDQDIDYRIKLEAPSSKLGPGAQVLQSVSALAQRAGLSGSQSDIVKINLKVTGTSTDPKVGLDGGDTAQSAKAEVKEQVKQIVDEKVDAAKEEARRKAKEQADKLIQEAEIQAEKVRAEAQSIAEKIRAEAEANAKKIESDAKGKGAIAERIAKEAANKVRKEGDDAAKKVISEADTQAKSIVDKAKAEADKLLQE
jgi:hypothetical protein